MYSIEVYKMYFGIKKYTDFEELFFENVISILDEKH